MGSNPIALTISKILEIGASVAADASNRTSPVKSEAPHENLLAASSDDLPVSMAQVVDT